MRKVAHQTEWIRSTDLRGLISDLDVHSGGGALDLLAARSRADLVGAGQSDLEGHDDLVILLRDLRSDYLHESINIVSAELNQARRQCAPRKN